ncbi:site-specific DNA-methyltransferase [Dyella sp. 20L07]|uniref:site-specific DNA-methyltransferase n=1 Tax=Dyella sp. 20L07 TaxID=3384240 RepID=UPI003D2BF046
MFIDPPYNTRSAFEHYDDNLEHAQWLSMMYPRLVLLRELLSEDGSIWVTLDDAEAHYLKVIMDEIFGRKNFVSTLIWEKADSPRNSARQFSSDHDFIFVYSKNEDWRPSKLPRDEKSDAIYTNPDNDERGPWLPGDPYANKPYSRGTYTLTGPTGRQFSPPPGRYWRISEEKVRELDEDNRIWWGSKKDARPSIKKFLSEVGDLVPRTFWRKEDVGSNRTSKNELRKLFPGDVAFDTPKPEALLERVIRIATKEGDIVLDSFLGSGTTAAVAHKMGRRWIGIEMGDHARTHCQPRLSKVVDGEQGGISEVVGWQGGGGFRFYTLGPKVFDDQGQVNPEIRFEHLAAHVWFAETGTARSTRAMKSPLLGVQNGVAYYLLFNGILGDASLSGGNMLTARVLAGLPPHDGPKVIYGAGTNMTKDRLRSLGVSFKQTPYDIRKG